MIGTWQYHFSILFLNQFTYVLQSYHLPNSTKIFTYDLLIVCLCLFWIVGLSISYHNIIERLTFYSYQIITICFNSEQTIAKAIESALNQTYNNIEYITEYAIRYFEYLLKKFGEDCDRKTQIESFDSISVRRVAIADQKLYVNKKDGFIGTSSIEGEFVCKCSKIDNIIVILSDGTLMITKISDKKYIGKNIIYANVWKKNDKHMIYNIAYIDGISKFTYVKRFSVTSLIKDRFYFATQGNDNSKILYFTANPNSESEIVSIHFHSNSKCVLGYFYQCEELYI